MKHEYDVIVAGGGPAGFAAAVTAAREGAETLLIEMHPFAGGAWTAGCMNLVFDCTPQPGFMQEFRADLESQGASAPWRGDNVFAVSPEKMKCILDEYLTNAGVTVRYCTMVQAAQSEGKMIREIETASKSGREKWKADMFIDATGDGDLGAFSGCGFDKGRESDGKMQPASMNAVIGGWPDPMGDQEKLGEEILAIFDKLEFDISYRKTRLFPIPGQPGLRRCMWTHLYGFDPTDADSLTACGIEGRRQVHKAVQVLRNSGDERFRDLFVVSTGPALAVREGRRIHGLYTLTADDLIKGKRFEDGICEIRFNIDIHDVDPSEGKHLKLEKVKPYLIPFRSMVACDIDNLLLAGRCISGDFRAHASYRTTSDCAAMGEVAGRAAALAADQGMLPREINSEDVKVF